MNSTLRTLLLWMVIFVVVILLWNTFQGSSGQDYGFGIVINNWRMVYLTGSAHGNFGIPINASKGDDAFVLGLGGWLLMLPTVVR